MSDRTQSKTADSAYRAVLRRPTHMPDSAEGVALEMTRMILALATTMPSRAEFLDLYAECLRAVAGQRRITNYGLH